MFLEVEARYATALNRAITRDGRTTFVVISPKGLIRYVNGEKTLLIGNRS